MRKIVQFIAILVAICIMFGCSSQEGTKEGMDKQMPDNPNYEIATVAGGCFWCVESAFDHVSGVISAVSGYSGGDEVNPTYKQVASGLTTHREAVQIMYDPNIITYEELLHIFWRQINPTDSGGQFVDRGFQYSSAIFYHDVNQKEIAQKSKENLNNLGVYNKEIVTPIIEFKSFYVAEEYHQDYHIKNPIRYKYYRHGSGRDRYLESVWGEE